jgi:hypothetical protein
LSERRDLDAWPRIAKVVKVIATSLLIFSTPHRTTANLTAMWTWPDLIATSVGVAGLAWAIVSWSIARSADSKARAAKVDAADANKRAADALEVANELTRKMLEGPPPPWTLDYELPNGWQLVNRTGHVASEVFIESPGDEFEEGASTWDGIQPNGIIILRAVQTFDYATVIVRWNRDRSHTVTVARPSH